MGDTPSRPAAASRGAPTVGGTSLEAALAEIEEERARWANVPPPGVHGPAEIELKEVESDEAMARRLQSEEDAVRGTSRGPTQATPAYYPRVPYAQPVPFGPNTAHAPGEGRGFMDDFTPGFLYGLGAPPPAPTYNPQPIRNGPGDFARPVPFGAPSIAYGGVQVGVPVAAHLVPRGVIPPHLAQQPENDAALARRLQAEEDAGGSGFCMTGSQNNTQPPSSRNNTHQPPLNLTSYSDDASLAAAMQAEENALAQTERGARFNPYAANPADDADAALARRLQSEEDAAGAGDAPNTSSVGRNALNRSGSSGFCPGCAKPVGSFGAHVRTSFGRWHQPCFKCGGCRNPISTGTHSMKDGMPYHTTCYAERYHPRCTVCCEKIPAEGNGRVVRWLTHPYWSNATYCPKHEHDGTKKCDGCERVESCDSGQEGVSYAELPDGRFLCLECASTAVVDQTNDGQRMYDAVCQFMADSGMALVKPGGQGGGGTRFTENTTTATNLLWSDRPPLHLVSQDALDAADGKERWHTGRTSRTRGLCLFSEHIIHTVQRTPRWDQGFAGGLFPVSFTERLIQKKVGDTTVNAVVVLYGLPAIAFGAILAHECVHAYIRIKGGFPKLAPKGTSFP